VVVVVDMDVVLVARVVVGLSGAEVVVVEDKPGVGPMDVVVVASPPQEVNSTPPTIRPTKTVRTVMMNLLFFSEFYVPKPGSHHRYKSQM
jgi:hypothetical protein